MLSCAGVGHVFFSRANSHAGVKARKQTTNGNEWLGPEAHGPRRLGDESIGLRQRYQLGASRGDLRCYSRSRIHFDLASNHECEKMFLPGDWLLVTIFHG